MKSKILFVVSLLNGILFVFAGSNKFFEFAKPPADMPEKLQKMNAAFAEIGWLMPLVGLVEVIGAVLLIIPKTRALGAIMLFPILIGILLVHVFAEPGGIPLTLALLLCNIWIIYENREKYFPMIN